MFPTPRIVSVWRNRERHGCPFLKLFKDIDSHLHLGNCLTFLFKYCSHRVLCSGQNYFHHGSKMLQRHYFADKGPSSQSYGFSSSCVWMWELDSKESWGLKNWCFWTVVLKKTLESPSDSKEIKPVYPKGNQLWIFIGRIDAEAEAPILWPPDTKNWLIWKDPDGGKDWRQEEKGMTEDEMVGWRHLLNGHGFEQTPGDSEGQGSLECRSPRGRKESDTTEWPNSNKGKCYLPSELGWYLHWWVKFLAPCHKSGASLVAQTVKNLPAMREIGVRSLSQEDLLEKLMATHSSIPAWKIPWTEEPGYSPQGRKELDMTEWPTLPLWHKSRRTHQTTRWWGVEGSVLVRTPLIKTEICTQCVCYISKHSDCLQEKHLWTRLNRELNLLPFPCSSIRSERMTDKRRLFSVQYSATFSQKWIKWVCHFTENNWQYLLPMKQSELSSKDSNPGELVSAILSLPASQSLKTFLMR